MPEYQVLARKYRPQTFGEVVGQEAIVTTLKNAIKNKRLAHAYLFCGSRGTGKTTLARILAKALNCTNPSTNYEPCNQCSFCNKITAGASLDVLEIDGASNRGIDDIRQINETVNYTTASGKYKIYIIDEVHMLTKEAFNALLKTLEEPPPKVIFLFATTEPHKVLPTIISRCQRFNLNRIPSDRIIQKLQRIAQEMDYTIEEEALHLIADHSEGGLRDAESLLDQILAFNEDDTISAASVTSTLGVMPRETLFELDRAGKAGNLAVAFDIAHRLFSEGKDLLHFIEMLTEHFRNILLIKLCGPTTPALGLSKQEKEKYIETAKLYRQDQCLALLDHMIETQNRARYATSGRMALESVLLHIMRSHARIPVDILIKKLSDLEGRLQGSGEEPSPTPVPTPKPTQTPTPPPPKQEPPTPTATKVSIPTQTPTPPPPKQEPPTPTATKVSIPTQTPTPPPPKQEPPTPTATKVSIPTQTPTPPPPKQEPPTPTATKVSIPTPPPKQETPPAIDPKTSTPPQEQQQYDTLLQFAAVELEGTIQK